MIDPNPNIPIITLNINDLKTPIKRQRLSIWIFFRKQDFIQHCLQNLI